MSEVGLLLFIAALSLIGLIMALFPRRLMEWLDNLEDKLFNRRPVEKAASMADKGDTPASRLSSIMVLVIRVVGIFTVLLGIFYIVMFVFVYPIN
jgi:hypothetical protein